MRSNIVEKPTVAITGASAGVGRAVVEAYAARGAKIGLLARGTAGLDGAKSSAERLGAVKVITCPVDVSDADAVEAAAERIETELGPIDVWVNDAMTSVFAKVLDITSDEYRRVMDVIFLGFVHGTQSALRRMMPRDRGVVVQVGSALGYRGIPAQPAYCAAKHAIQGFNDSLRAELNSTRSNVRVSSVQMPALNTPQFDWVRTRLPNHPQPVPPIYQPEVAAEAVLWAADHRPREINVGSSTIKARLGDKFAPGFLDWYLGRSGISSQQTDQQVDPQSRPDNLFEPQDEDVDHGAHGSFGDTSKTSSKTFWAVTHKPLLAGVAAAAVSGAVTGMAVARKK
ncbi:SDR family oxidoreductase [Arthrobacter castelli]|uniref:SDR family oxidoreductase n=1 Tax=Arthrobacter castelli TaxID=271431 RepID=UPI0004162480|nr:SDR family oxidoreductase [Arthrobacter castelli]